VKAALDGTAKTPDQLAAETESDPEDVFHVLNHLVANASNVEHSDAEKPGQETFHTR
jgi:hypothetical protein